MATIEKESQDKTGLRSDVVTLYQGGQYHLYTFKKYTDVRLVFAPEFDIAFFGGDPDNFEYPRYDLDVCFFRAYEDGKPARPAHYLKWSPAGSQAGELVFVAGHPGRTNRLNTLAHLEYLRDVNFPFSLDLFKDREAFLRQLGIEVLSHVVAVGCADLRKVVSWEQIRGLSERDDVLLNCVDSDAEQQMKEEVDKVLRTGDSVGGIFEVVAHSVPPGLGTYAQWDERLDGLLASAVMSLQAVKAVEIGAGVTAASSAGSAVHDEIGYAASAGFAGFTRSRNNAGGIEGGVSNGEDIVVRGYLKPISTLRRPLQSVDFASREPVKAAYERSDVCVVPAAGVAAEAMVALTVARCALEKFGGDSMTETLRNFKGYLDQVKNY